MVKTNHLVYLCHVVDERTKSERAISSDSPAAANKVVGICNALRSVNVRCTILSSGRGRQNGSGTCHSPVTGRHRGVTSVNARFLHLPFLTHFVTMLSLAALIVVLLRKYPGARVLAYNRSYHYLVALVIARFMGAVVFLDLEDGYINQTKGILRYLKNSVTRIIFDFLCPGGSLLASSALRNQVGESRTLVCYGVASGQCVPLQDWSSAKIRILFGGTLIEEVGPQLLLDALEILLTTRSSINSEMEVIVTGKGPWESHFSDFAQKNPELLTFCKNLTYSSYGEVLRKCHVGLSLRLAEFEMGMTTFPSKVLEYACNGLLIVSTRSSDVPLLMGQAAIYLEKETAGALAELLAFILDGRGNLQALAKIGHARVLDQCNQISVGSVVSEFLFE